MVVGANMLEQTVFEFPLRLIKLFFLQY